VKTLEAESARSQHMRSALAKATAGVITALTALTDPACVVLGGSWGTHPQLIELIQAEVALGPRPVPVRPALVTHEPSLAGARTQALVDLQAAILALRK
jgi:hypothetical protein